MFALLRLHGCTSPNARPAALTKVVTTLSIIWILHTSRYRHANRARELNLKDTSRKASLVGRGEGCSGQEMVPQNYLTGAPPTSADAPVPSLGQPVPLHAAKLVQRPLTM